MTQESMLCETRGAVGHMIFNNPARHNAVSLDMWDRAEAIIDGFMADQNVRVIVMSGAGGKAFVSGADISKFETERGTREAVAHYNARVKAVYNGIKTLAKPTIAMIDGYCIGGGLALAVACDLRMCSEKSRFGLPAARLGLGYPFDGLKRLVDTIGPGATLDIVFSARRLDAEEARSIGLVQKVLPAVELESHVFDYARTVAANAPLTVASMKLIVGEALKDPAERDLAACERAIQACFESDDYIEGRRAFTEKREPRFTGR